MGFIRNKKLTILMVLETHAHADHLSGSQELKRIFPQAKLAIGHGITEVQKIFKSVYNFAPDFAVDGRQFDRLLRNGERVKAGRLLFEVIDTPGHTPACTTFRFEDKIFTVDAIFMPDYGTGRCDFPGGSAEHLYQSIQNRLYTLPDETKVYTGHDYPPNGRPLAFLSTIGEQKAKNIQLNARTSMEDFVHFRQTRDVKLKVPHLLHPCVQVNIDAGHVPEPESNGLAYVKIPLKIK